MKRVLLQPAYVLHRRPYRESSFLVDLFTPEHGRFTAVAKGIRKARSPLPGLLQPFIPLLVSWAGNGELVALSQAEIRQHAEPLHGDCLFAGFYLNELLNGLLAKWDAQPLIFACYEQAVIALQGKTLDEIVLRTFELQLIDALGYGLLPPSIIEQDKLFDPQRYYRFIPEQGFVVCEGITAASNRSTLFSGKHLRAIARGQWQEEGARQEAKRLTRLILTPLLGARPLHSRRLFVPHKEESVSTEESLA